MQAENQLKRIQEKLQAVVKEHGALRKENLALQGALEQAQQKLTEQQLHVEELRQQVTVLRLNAASLGEQDKKEFEKTINGYIREIDRCIALLGE